MAKEYPIPKPDGVCSACEGQIEPETEFVAIVREVGGELQRQNYCAACWAEATEQTPAKQQSDVLGVWHTRLPKPEEKKKMFVDDELLMNFFQRLEGTQDDAKINFRFVLTLVLMRKKLLVYEGSCTTDDGVETWKMRRKGSDETYEVTDPHMDEEKISQVSHQLGDILETNLE